MKKKKIFPTYLPNQKLQGRGTANKIFFKDGLIHLPKYVTHIIGEPKYKYGHQEQVPVRNHNRSTALKLAFLLQFSSRWKTFTSHVI